MAGIVSESCKQQIRERVPLEELVREYNVHLVPSGRRLKGLCPFHAEKSPSFSIDVEKQYFYCFGCHAGGDLFSFVKGMHHVDYREALEILARRAGVALEYEGGHGPSRESQESRQRIAELYDVLELAQDFYHRYLLEDPAARPAREYLKRRGIDPALWERFRLGFSPPEWGGFLEAASRRGAPAQLLERAGLARKRDGAAGYYDYFRGRVMFPIQDPQGRVIGFGARTLGDEQPKYLNTPKTSLFEKSQVLYALPQARAGIQREGRIAIVEGYTDAVMAHQVGLDFFVASLGTAFTQENARRLARLAPRVLLVFDGDDAGQKASERSLDLLVSESLDVRVYTVRDGKDPCDAILALSSEEGGGGAAFRRRLEAESIGLFEFKWRRTMESAGAEDAGPALRARALDEFLSLVARVPNVVARKLYVREFAERLGIPERDVEARLKQVSRRAVGAPAGAHRGPAPAPAGEGAGRESAQELAGVTLECLLALPGKAKTIWSQVPRRLFEEPGLKSVAEAIDRLLGRGLEGGEPLAARLMSEVEDAEAFRAISSALSRLEDDEGNPSCDYEEVWIRVQRDLARHARRARLEEIKRRLSAESDPEGARTLESLRREYFEILRELKK